MIGIYSITSPTGKVYIGQSIDIEHRWKGYFRGKFTSQRRLYSSLMKYGTDNHEFRVVEECDIEKLNQRERHWQDYFDATGKDGLNCILTKTNDRSGVGQKHSDEEKRKISEANKGKVMSDESNEKNRSAHKGRKHSDEAKRNMSISRKGKKHKPMSEQGRSNISIGSKGKVISDEHKKKISDTLKGRVSPNKGKKHPMSAEGKKNCSEAKKVYWQNVRDSKMI